MKDTEIIIIGAGAAGLMAARELSRAGRKVAVLEARDRIGGRILPLDEKIWGYSAMGGGEFVHGGAPVTTALAKEAGLEVLDFKNYSWKNMSDTPTPPRTLMRDETFLEALKKPQQDMSIAEFFARYLPGDEHAELRGTITRRIQGYDAADIERASVFSLRDELLGSVTWQQAVIAEGYGALIRYLEAQCKERDVSFQFGKRVIAIELNEKEAVARCEDGSEYSAPKIIITVPLPVLREISFQPAVPQKLEAASKLGFGGAIKILLRFKTEWWKEGRETEFEKPFFLFSGQAIPTWWSQPKAPYLTLTGWLGSAAMEQAQSGDEHLLDLALDSLSKMFSTPRENIERELVVSQVANWPADPLTRGAYSYATPESRAAIAELLEPVEGKIFFSGEAVYQGIDTGTVEAALAAGVYAAQSVVTS